MSDITEIVGGGWGGADLACIGGEEKYTQVWWENLKEREHLEDLDEEK